MIEITQIPLKTIQKLQAWLEKDIAPHLKSDVSTYARGRQRVWLRTEPLLKSTRLSHPGSVRTIPGLEIPDKYWNRLQEIINWKFDYCLVTYSGKENPIGISPHRDASYADYGAMGLNVSGHCLFSYWNDRDSFGKSESTGKWPYPGHPTCVIALSPGDLVRFNCKNVHSAEPGPDRWNMNFWKKK